MSSLPIYEPQQASRRREFDIRGAKYSVSEWGSPSAPLLMYLHGWADAGATFQFVVDALQDDWHVVAPDLRGFGHSTVNATSYWFPDYVADLHELIEIYSPDAPVRLIGHSMGANVAALYAGAMPERVSAFVNIEGFGLVDADPAEAPGRLAKWIEAAQARPRFFSYADFPELATRIAKRNPCLTPLQAGFVAAEWGTLREDGRVVLRADPLHKLPNPILYRRAEAQACWQAISAAVLLVTGGESDLSAFTGIDGDSLFPGDQQVCLPGAGHMLHFDTPGPLAAEIEAFMREYL